MTRTFKLYLVVYGIVQGIILVVFLSWVAPTVRTVGEGMIMWLGLAIVSALWAYAVVNKYEDKHERRR